MARKKSYSSQLAQIITNLEATIAELKKFSEEEMPKILEDAQKYQEVKPAINDLNRIYTAKQPDQQAGDQQPGQNQQPGSEQPGQDQPGPEQPGQDQPGPDQPGQDQQPQDKPHRKRTKKQDPQ